ncbi:uncharacterized protein PHALS_10167 [Plasmopara halstedii]|uniref:Uncharacterized protein n=1 Tax=Plasmopara halstedii TaxID=4781 RepID=A0A0P1AHJ4_PLAHL|nr:uncharacterized protein PHALS_10167 [Plasmopara halstedii]CEG39942.1 hypothetical protein PHALS_10167 [Plasmopara halstedii]|eukprot:XP_024576311.1 hypothetical protein PHALS_10167 [Plasmopara halstedii]
MCDPTFSFTETSGGNFQNENSSTSLNTGSGSDLPYLPVNSLRGSGPSVHHRPCWWRMVLLRLALMAFWS